MQVKKEVINNICISKYNRWGKIWMTYIKNWIYYKSILIWVSKAEKKLNQSTIL